MLEYFPYLYILRMRATGKIKSQRDDVLFGEALLSLFALVLALPALIWGVLDYMLKISFFDFN